MFKIKVGLKSFQTHSMQKCKYQIGRIACDLKQSKTLFSRDWEKRRGSLSNRENQKVKTDFGITSLPTLVKKITLLRSPHIDKKSREQFEWKREKAQINIDLSSVQQISLLLFILTHSRFPGVEIEIGIESTTYFA